MNQEIVRLVVELAKDAADKIMDAAYQQALEETSPNSPEFEKRFEELMEEAFKGMAGFFREA